MYEIRRQRNALFLLLPTSASLLTVAFCMSTTASFDHLPSGEHDFIICGGGAAGITIAYLLANRGHHVLLLEAGEDNDNELQFYTPFGMSDPARMTTFGHAMFPKSKYFWTDVPGNGRTLGGGSGCNGQQFWRGSMQEYRAQGSWFNRSDFDMPAFMKHSEAVKHWNGSYWEPTRSEYRGIDGPFGVVTFPETPVANMWKRAIQTVLDRHNMPSLRVDDFAEISQERDAHSKTGAYNFWGDIKWNSKGNMYERVRHSSSIALLKLRRIPRRLTVKTKATVDKLLFGSERSHAIGVQYLQNGVTKEAFLRSRSMPLEFTSSKVILSAGVHDAQILQRSGVGSAADLREAKIKPFLINDEVGKHLVNHATYGTYHMLTGIPSSLHVEEMLSHINDFVSIGQYHDYGNKNLSGPGPPWEIMVETLPNGDLVVTCVFNTASTESEGFVRTISSDPLQGAAWHCPVLQDDRDAKSMARLLSVAWEAVRQLFTAIKSMNIPDAQNVKLWDRASEMDELVRAPDAQKSKVVERLMAQGILRPPSAMAHAAGSMSLAIHRSPNGAANDLHVKGFSNVMVADAQVMKPVITGHTQYAAIMMGVLGYMSITGDVVPRF